MKKNPQRTSNLTTSVGTVFYLADGTIKSCNPDAEKILGYTADQLVNASSFDPPWQTIYEDGSPFSPENHPAIASIRTRQSYSDVVMGFYKPDGSLVWLSIDSLPLFKANNTEPYGVEITFRDITPQPTSPTEPRQIDPLEVNSIVRSIIADTTDIVFVKNLQGQYVVVNQAAADFLGMRIEDILGQDDAALFEPEIARSIAQMDRQVMTEGIPFSSEEDIPNSETQRVLLTSKYPWQDDEGNVCGIIGISKDITAFKQSEQKLQESEERFKLATVASGIGMWFWDIVADTQEWTDLYREIFGLPPDAPASYQEFINSLHPEDRDRTNQAVESALANKTEYRIEYRIIWADGSVHWILAKGRGFYNQTGEPVRMMGTVQDIDYRKNYEKSLQESSQRITNILESMTDAFYALDRDFNFTYINQEAESLLARSRSELLGHNVWQEFSPTVGTELDRQYHRALEEQIGSRFEYFYPPLDTWFEISVYPSVDGLSVYFRDITESRLAAAQIQRSEQQLRRVLDSLFSFIGVLEPDGVLIEVNRTALEAANLKPEDVIGQPFAECYWWSYSSQSQVRLNEAIQRAKAGEAVRYDVEVRLGTDSYITIDFALVPLLDANGQVEYLIPSGIDINDRKQAERALQRNEGQLRKILDSLPVYVGLLNPQGKVININQTALEGVNVKLEDVVGQPFAETPWWTFPAEAKAKVEETIKRAAAGESVRFDILARGRGAEQQIMVEFSMIPLFNEEGKVEYLVPSGVDITEREASKQALQESQQELKLITEVIPQQIWTATPDGEIDYLNQRWQDYTGVDLEQIKEHGWSSIVHPEDLEQVNEAWMRSIQLGEKYNLETRLRSAGGTYHWFLTRARPLYNKQGEIAKWYGTNTGINRIKELEQQLREQTEDLIRANQLKDEFLAIVSHELRTPLNPILGWSQLLAAGRLDAKKTAMGVGIIERNAKLQAQLIEDLLDVSRILRGNLNLRKDSLNLESVVRSALTTVSLSAEAKSIQIETNFEPNILQVSGDAGRLQQVVWNLVSNAIKFTPEGGRVTVSLKQIDRQAQIQVTDTGQGIDREFLPYVFDRFRQAESSSTRKYGGLGLGLAIVRHLTELHGGTVAVSSPGLGQGATFRVKLPLINTVTVRESNDVVINESVESERFNGLKVLVVDDEIDSLDILTLVLQQEGAEINSASSAIEAIEAFNRATPDLIISDLGMPETDGFALIEQIRALPQGANIPAIALTAYAGDIDRQRSLEAGFQAHISKPINIPNLINTIAQLI